MVNVTTTLEWTGCALGLLGAALLAFNFRYSRYGWLAFLGANVAMISFALLIDKHGLLVSQIGFACTSVLGMWRSGLFCRFGTAAGVITAETTLPVVTGVNADGSAVPEPDRSARIGQTMATAISASRMSHPRAPQVIRRAADNPARSPHGNT